LKLLFLYGIRAKLGFVLAIEGAAGLSSPHPSQIMFSSSFMAPQKGHFQVNGEDFELEETPGLNEGMG